MWDNITVFAARAWQAAADLIQLGLDNPLVMIAVAGATTAAAGCAVILDHHTR